LLTIEQVAEQLQFKVKTIYNWQTTGYGPKPIRVGKALRWKPEAVEAWIASLEPESNVVPIKRKTA